MKDRKKAFCWKQHTRRTIEDTALSPSALDQRRSPVTAPCGTRHWVLWRLIKDAAQSPVLVEHFSFPFLVRPHSQSLAPSSLLGCRLVESFASSRSRPLVSLGVMSSSLADIVNAQWSLSKASEGQSGKLEAMGGYQQVSGPSCDQSALHGFVFAAASQYW